MSEDRRDLCLQLERAREEFDYMKAIQSSCVTDYQAQLADLKQVKMVADWLELGRVPLLLLLYHIVQTCEETESKLNKTAVQLNTNQDQLRQVREMLNAERSSKEKANSSLANQLEMAKRKIGNAK